MMPKKAAALNPWKRKPPQNPDPLDPDAKYYVTNLMTKRPKFTFREHNLHIDIHNKRAALNASSSVVSLISYTGEEELYQSSGTIIETDSDNKCTVLTSAKLIRLSNEKHWKKHVQNNIADDLKVVVKLPDGRSYQAEVITHCFHYNLVIIRFHSEFPLPSATITHIDDSMDLSIHEASLRPHSTSFKLVPGDPIVVVGRYFAKPFDLMAAPGQFSVDRHYDYDCKEIFLSTCKITRCGDGGPVINLSGEVIGIAFYSLCETPFMPINVVYKWWERYKRHGELRRPSLGMEATNFYTAKLALAEKIIREFPTVIQGVIVEKVIPGSSADSAGLRSNDVIIQFAGKEVRSFLELCEMLWDRIGDYVELVVARVGHTAPLHLKMTVAEATQDDLNSWPRWDLG